jgi:ferredoxin
VLQVTLFASQGAATVRRSAVTRCWPASQIDRLTGWLGAFDLQWTKNNPIDLDLCTRCNACVAACPEGAIGLDYQINLQTLVSQAV